MVDSAAEDGDGEDSAVQTARWGTVNSATSSRRTPGPIAVTLIVCEGRHRPAPTRGRGVWIPGSRPGRRVRGCGIGITFGNAGMTTLSPSGFLTIGDARLEYRMIGPSPESAPTIVMLHEGLGSAGLWGDFPEKLQAATGAGVFVYSRAGYGHSTPVNTAAADRLHACRGARRAAKAARQDRLSPRHAARPFRRRLDRCDLCRRASGPSRAGSGADRPAFHRRGYFGGLDRGDQDRVRDHEPEEQSSRAGTRTSTTRSTAGTAPGSIRNSATGIFPNTSPISACRWRSCRAQTISMARCGRSRSRRRSAIVRSM